MKYDFTAKKCRLENGRVAWVLKSQLKGCVSQGYTLDNAIKELEVNEKEWLDTAKLYHIEIPDELA